MIIVAVVLLSFFNANLKFHFCLENIFKKSTHQQHKKDNTGNINIKSTGWVQFEPSDAVFKIIVSAVPLFCFFYNLHFHCFLALIFFVIVIIVVQYFRRMYLQNFALHHNTTEATTKKRLATQFLFCLLNYVIIFSNLVFISNCCLLWLHKHSFSLVSSFCQ